VAAARLTVSAPRVVRGGLLTQVRMQVHARRAIDNPQLILDRGWFDGMQVNGIEPQPSQESGYGNKVVLAYDRMNADATLTVWLALQVDPTFPCAQIGSLDDVRFAVLETNGYISFFKRDAESG